jgi:hypothetical protein
LLREEISSSESVSAIMQRSGVFSRRAGMGGDGLKENGRGPLRVFRLLKKV